MGMSASQARFTGLTARKSDVEFQGQQINQARMNLATESATITTAANAIEQPTLTGTPSGTGTYVAAAAGATVGKDGVIMKDGKAVVEVMKTTITDEDIADYTAQMSAYTASYNAAMAELAPVQLKDKKLEIQLKQVDTEQQAISTELDAVAKVIDKNIESSFKTFA